MWRISAVRRAVSWIRRSLRAGCQHTHHGTSRYSYPIAEGMSILTATPPAYRSGPAAAPAGARAGATRSGGSSEAKFGNHGWTSISGFRRKAWVVRRRLPTSCCLQFALIRYFGHVAGRHRKADQRQLARLVLFSQPQDRRICHPNPQPPLQPSGGLPGARPIRWRRSRPEPSSCGLKKRRPLHLI
jgi:hypothetical protein